VISRFLNLSFFRFPKINNREGKHQKNFKRSEDFQREGEGGEGVQEVKGCKLWSLGLSKLKVVVYSDFRFPFLVVSATLV
jgi:hypothetical protein